MESVRGLVGNKKIQVGFVIVVFIIIAIIGLYMGLKGFSSSMKKKNSVYKPDTVFFTLYYVDWCPHCLTTKTVYDEVQGNWDGKKTKGGLNIVVRQIDCTDETQPAHIVNGKEITSFPTIYFDDGINDQVEFMSKCEYKTFTKFIEDMTEDI